MTRIVMLVHDEGGTHSASFPDFPGATTAAGDLDTLYRKAAEALTLHVRGMAKGGAGVPAVRSLAELRRDPEFRGASEGALVSLVEMDLPGSAARTKTPADLSGSGFLRGAR